MGRSQLSRGRRPSCGHSTPTQDSILVSVGGGAGGGEHSKSLGDCSFDMLGMGINVPVPCAHVQVACPNQSTTRDNDTGPE